MPLGAVIQLGVYKMENKQFTEVQEQAIELLARKEVEGYSMQDVASLIGVSRQALYDWMKIPNFKRAVNRKSLDALTDYAPKVLYNASQFLDSKNETVKLKGVELVMRAVDAQEQEEKREKEKPIDIDAFMDSIGIPKESDTKGWIDYYEKRIEEYTELLNKYKQRAL